MMTKPLVSVIIPNYNHARFLRERIDSVLAQDYDDYEIILLDDHSTDDSAEILKSYAQNPHIAHIVFNKQNSGGPFAQWSKGIALARGEYIWIAESDDVANPRLLGTLMREISKYPDAVVAFAHSQLIDKKSEKLPYGWHDEDTEEVFVYDGHQFVMNKMLTSNYIYNASMALFRKSAYEMVDTGFVRYSYCGDWAFWIDLSLKGKVIEVCSVLNSYRQHKGQTTLESVKSGVKWIEMGHVLKYAINLLNLSPFQRQCLRGRYTKRFRKEEIPNKEEVLAQHREVFGGSSWDICCYEIGKLFNFLKS